MPEVGLPELLIILVIVLILFGPGRLARAGTALGQAMRAFRQEVSDEPKEIPPPELDASKPDS